MNVHHLELFYYVAKYRGIGPAVKNMPYGIQQPAVSSQLIRLEKELEVTLFQRRPFLLTPSGEALFRFITPFFANIDSFCLRLKEDSQHLLRIGSSHTVLRDHLPQLIKLTRKDYPQLKVHLHELTEVQSLSLLETQEIDLAITLLNENKNKNLQILNLIDLPLVLLLPKSSPYAKKTVDFILKSMEEQAEPEPLISLPPNESLCHIFQDHLSALKLRWATQIEVNSLNLIEKYVIDGFGIGLSVLYPHRKFSPKIKVLPLKGFPKLQIGAMWRGELNSVASDFLKHTKEYVRQF